MSGRERSGSGRISRSLWQEAGMPRFDLLAREEYEKSQKLPEGAKTILGDLLLRNSMTLPLAGSRLDASVYGGFAACRKAATYLVAGMGRMYDGKEIFSLKNRVCLPPVPGLREGNVYVLLDCHYFVATPADGQPVLLTVSTEKTKVPLGGSGIVQVRDINETIRDETDIKVTVQGYGLNGKPKSADYHWTCLVEAGVGLLFN
jgi:hypothetical protein